MHHSRMTNTSSFFLYSVLLVSAGYLIFEYFFIPYAALSADEFVFARHIYEYTFNLPYRDFPPYKTVLGYYLLSLPLFFFHSLLQPLFYIKGEIALINAGFIILCSLWATRFFDRKAVLFALLAVLANHTFLIYSADLRVDMLTSWLCLLMALCVLNHYFRLGGILFGIAFLVSQKALWYLVAIDGAMLICWLCNRSSSFSLRTLLIFNVTAVMPIALYVLGWSLIVGPSEVLYSLFYEAYIQAGIDWFIHIYLMCWEIALKRGPLLFLLWPLAFICLFEKSAEPSQLDRRLFLVSFASIALILFINYKQPFPYNFVLTVPAFFLLYAEFMTWFFMQKKVASGDPARSTLSLYFIYLMAFYIFWISVIIILFALNPINYLIALVPLLMSILLFLEKKTIRLSCFYVITIIMVAVGIVYPFYRSLVTSIHLNGNYQKKMIYLTASLLEKNEDYVGGVPFLYQKDQPIEGLKNLIGPALDYLYDPTKQLEPLLLPSLYLVPTTVKKVIDDFERKPVKVVINNYRILTLPSELSEYIHKHYQHFYGSLYLYAPEITPDQLTFHLKFTGRYRIESAAKKPIIIDGKRRHPGQTIQLKEGDHLTDAARSYRLQLVPEVARPVDPIGNKDNWLRMIRAILS